MQEKILTIVHYNALQKTMLPPGQIYLPEKQKAIISIIACYLLSTIKFSTQETIFKSKNN